VIEEFVKQTERPHDGAGIRRELDTVADLEHNFD